MKDRLADPHRLNGVARHANAGLSQRIRSALAYGPLTAEAIAKLTGAPAEKVRQMLCQIASQTGGVVRIPVQGPAQWALYDDPGLERARKRTKTSSGSGQIAGRRTIPAYKF